MIFPHTLRIVHAAIHSGSVVLREAHESLQEYEDVENEAENGVRRLEVGVAGAALVNLDNDEAGEEGGDAEEVEEEVGGCAGTFLAGGVGWLKDEGGLRGEEEAG